jgi:hypothetical protein
MHYQNGNLVLRRHSLYQLTISIKEHLLPLQTFPHLCIRTTQQEIIAKQATINTKRETPSTCAYNKSTNGVARTATPIYMHGAFSPIAARGQKAESEKIARITSRQKSTTLDCVRNAWRNAITKRYLIHSRALTRSHLVDRRHIVVLI